MERHYLSRNVLKDARVYELRWLIFRRFESSPKTGNADGLVRRSVECKSTSCGRGRPRSQGGEHIPVIKEAGQLTNGQERTAVPATGAR